MEVVSIFGESLATETLATETLVTETLGEFRYYSTNKDQSPSNVPMPNRLSNESSPYLLQHQNNPVDWYPWGEEALKAARQLDRPIFLSIGYSACHWCHVMERESFEDEAIAAFLNEHFVNIKVDREERPDLDQIYMRSVMALRGGQGGWPLSAFLTPDLKAFFGGTYWPPKETRHPTGATMPGFDSVIRQVHQAFVQQRENINEQAEKVAAVLTRSVKPESETQQKPVKPVFVDEDHDAENENNETSNANGDPPETEPDGTDKLSPEALLNALAYGAARMQKMFDFENGGFGGAPKFPQPTNLQVLMRLAMLNVDFDHDDVPDQEQALLMVQSNLQAMGLGGIHDHLGGGFARYSVDAGWLVPHFEKMLYDNAQLMRTYSEYALLSSVDEFASVAEKTFEYLQRDMLDKRGGFYSSEDADSEGVEGKFYVWTPDEVAEVLGKETAEKFCALYDVTPEGNFEGKSILNLNGISDAEIEVENPQEHQQQMQVAMEKLFAARQRRVRPAKDDKILTNWNALTIEGLATLLSAVRDTYDGDDADEVAVERLLSVLRNSVAFTLSNVDIKGSLLHSYRDGRGSIPAFLDDYGLLIGALVSAASVDPANSATWISNASRLAHEMLNQFGDPDEGGLFYTRRGQRDIVARIKDLQDGSTPSGNGSAALALIRLARVTGQFEWFQKSTEILRWALPEVQRYPVAHGHFLLTIIESIVAPTLIQVVLPSTEASATDSPLVQRLLRPIEQWNPFVMRVFGTEQQFASNAFHGSLSQGRVSIDDQPTAYICQGQTCFPPTTDPAEAIRLITEL